MWVNLGITVAGLAAVLVLAALRARLPRARSAPALIARAVLAFTVAVVAWTSIALPLLPVDVATGSAAEHVLLAGAAAATVAVAAASWLGR